MAITLQNFNASDVDYIQKHNNNNAALTSAVNALQAAVLGTLGPGGPLITDVFDRPGLVGSHSYVLDLENYAGGISINIGRRPVPIVGIGEIDVSIAWGNFSGTFSRVTLTGDAVLNGSAITAGLPKTIYVGVTSNGAPQLFETDVEPNVLYAYSMTWDGFAFTDFKRMAHILPGYTLIRDVAGRPILVDVFDPETDFVSDITGMTSVMLPGALDDNEIAEMSYEVLGFFVNCPRADEDGFYAPAAGGVDDVAVRFKVVSDAVDWTAQDFDFDASNMPDVQFVSVNPAVGDLKYVTEFRTFELERTHLGGNVVSARAFQWGVIVRPIYGLPMPKDSDFVTLV